MDYYMLKDRKIIPTNDPREWSQQFTKENKRIAQTTIGNYWVSTVFLGLDHNWSNQGEPILFETMVFPVGDFTELYCYRYTSVDAAEAGHAKVIAAVQTIVDAGREIEDGDIEQLTKD